MVLLVVVGSHLLDVGFSKVVMVSPHLDFLGLLLEVNVLRDWLLGEGLLGHRLAVAVLVTQHEMVGPEIVFLFVVEFGVLNVGVHRVVVLKRSLVAALVVTQLEVTSPQIQFILYLRRRAAISLVVVHLHRGHKLIG